jgi:quercetin dioxygenase-like cupin family protein
MEQGKAIVVAPGAGKRVGNVEFLALSQDSPRFTLSLITMAPGREGPAEHVHQDEDDAFYVLDDEIRFVVEGEDVVEGRGDVRARPAGGGAHVSQSDGLAGAHPEPFMLRRALTGGCWPTLTDR